MFTHGEENQEQLLFLLISFAYNDQLVSMKTKNVYLTRYKIIIIIKEEIIRLSS